MASELEVGKVGIGTAPIADSKLDVAGAGTQRLYVRETGSTVKTKLLTTTSKGAVGTETNHPLELQTNDQPRVTIASDGKIGQNCTPVAFLHVQAADASVEPAATADVAAFEFTAGAGIDGISLLYPDAKTGQIVFGTPSDNDAGRIVYGGPSVTTAADQDAMRFHTAGAEAMRISSTGLATFSGGIALQTSPTNASATANEAYTLDKYETGTWTPTLPNGGTLQTNSGTYTRIGNICHLQFYVSSISPTANTSQFRIGGLPFTVSDDANYFAAGSIGYAGDGQFVNYRLIGNNNTTTCYFHTVAGNNATLSNNDFISQFSGSNDALVCSLTYKVK